jgi:hypothetical protein
MPAWPDMFLELSFYRFCMRSISTNKLIRMTQWKEIEMNEKVGDRGSGSIANHDVMRCRFHWVSCKKAGSNVQGHDKETQIDFGGFLSMAISDFDISTQIGFIIYFVLSHPLWHGKEKEIEKREKMKRKSHKSV